MCELFACCCGVEQHSAARRDASFSRMLSVELNLLHGAERQLLLYQSGNGPHRDRFSSLIDTVQLMHSARSASCIAAGGVFRYGVERCMRRLNDVER